PYLSIRRALRHLLFFQISLPPRSTLFPYTTLFRSLDHRGEHVAHDERSAVARKPIGRGENCAEIVGRAAPLRSEPGRAPPPRQSDRKSTRLNSSHVEISYAVFCLKKKTKPQPGTHR